MLSGLELINTRNRIITVRGKVIYNDRKRKIDLKRPIRDLFDATSVDVFYMMELCLNKKKALELYRLAYKYEKRFPNNCEFAQKRILALTKPDEVLDNDKTSTVPEQVDLQDAE